MGDKYKRGITAIKFNKKLELNNDQIADLTIKIKEGVKRYSPPKQRELLAQISGYTTDRLNRVNGDNGTNAKTIKNTNILQTLAGALDIMDDPERLSAWKTEVAQVQEAQINFAKNQNSLLELAGPSG